MAVLRLKVKTNAPGDRVEGFMSDGTLKVAVSAKPINGQANRALIRLLANVLGLNPSGISILSGASSSRKMVRVDVEDEKLHELLENPSGGKK